jgi:hypothetical protein
MVWLPCSQPGYTKATLAEPERQWQKKWQLIVITLALPYG